MRRRLPRRRPGVAGLTADLGFRLVARVHRAEGRIHSESGATVEQARALLEQEGLERIAKLKGHLHEVAIMVKRGSGSTRDRLPRSHR